MSNLSKYQNAAIFAVIVLGYFVWISSLYIGIPIALLIGFIAWKMFKSFENDRSQNGAQKRLIAIIGGVGAVVLVILSVSSNLSSTGASQTEAASVSLTADEEEAIKASANGCHDGWRDKYLTYEDCLAGISANQRMLEAQ